MDLGRSPSGVEYSLVIQSVAQRYELRDLPGRSEVLNIPLQSIVVVQIRAEQPWHYQGNRREGPDQVFEQKLKVIGAYPDGSQTRYFGQLLGASDGLALTVKPVGNQPPGIEFRSDHVLRIEQVTPSIADDNVIMLDPIYETRHIHRLPDRPFFDEPVGLYYDNRLIGIIESRDAPALMHILKPTHPENIHEADSDPNNT